MLNNLKSAISSMLPQWILLICESLDFYYGFKVGCKLLL